VFRGRPLNLDPDRRVDQLADLHEVEADSRPAKTSFRTSLMTG
jgi:hypothetical protein